MSFPPIRRPRVGGRRTWVYRHRRLARRRQRGTGQPPVQPTRGSAWDALVGDSSKLPVGQGSAIQASVAAAGHLLHQLADHILGVAKEHPGTLGKVELVVDAGESWILAALDGKHGPGLVGVDDGHAVNGAAAIRARG